MQDKESEKNPFLVTIKADFVHLAIRGFNFINIMMIIFSWGKFLLWVRTFQILRVVGTKVALRTYFALFCQSDSDQLHLKH